MPENSLKNKAISGVGWSAIDSFLGQGITFIVGLVLARLLSPSEYGLIGLTSIFITIFNSIIDSGFSQALIRKKDVTNDDYNTMFITNMVLSIIMFTALFFCAPFIASFFKRLELIKLTRVMGLVLIINAFSITQNTVLTKRIDFKTRTKASLISALVSGAVGISMAFMGYGVWALVSQQITKQTVNTVCLWIFNRWWPNFTFSHQSLKYMWGFGWKLLASGLLDNIWSQIYHLVVGKFYSPNTLGQYSRAREYPSIFSSNLNMIVSRVSFPVLASIQDDKVRLLNAYRRIIKTTMFVTAVCLIFMGAIAEPMIYCLVGTKWHQAATFIPLICISLSLYPLHSINLNMLKVQGRSDLFLRLEIIKKIVAIGPICLGIFVGIYSMVVGSVVTGIINLFLNSYYSGKYLGYSFLMQMKDIAPFYGIGIIIAFSVYFFKYLHYSYFIILSIQLTIGIIDFFIICNFTKLKEYSEFKSLIFIIINKIMNKIVRE